MMERSEEYFHSGGSERRGLQPSSFLVTGVIFDADSGQFQDKFRTEDRNFDKTEVN